MFDLEHIRAVGVSATGKKYHAWNLGPVSEELYYSIHGDMENGLEDFKESFDVEMLLIGEKEAYQLNPKFTFDEDVFSKYQLDLLAKLATKYKNFGSRELVDATHKKNDPWHIVFEIYGKAGQEIPMRLALDSVDSDKKEMLLSRYCDLHGES
jgi:uncharacterized phage-associated protein